MRIERLELTRYGRFTGQTLDFGPPRPGQPDLHVVYGPNEAGKTTLLNAWLDLLYGMAPNTPFAFQHGYDAMRIGARLALAGGAQDFVRVKRARNSLLDAAGHPLPEETLLAAMGGLSRAAYANMFSLDAAALEAGGREAAESRGQLGEMLFAASAGLGALSRRLAALREEADAFWRPRARKSALAQLRAELLELRQQRDAIDTIASRHAALNAELQRCVAGHDEAGRTLARLKQRAGTVRDMLAALALAPRLAALRQERATLPAFPPAPPEWSGRAAALREADARARALMQTLREREQELTRRLDERPDDDAGCTLAPELEQLAELHSRHATAILDIPRLGHDLEASDLRLQELVRQLGRAAGEDAASLLLPAHQSQALRELIDRRVSLDARLHEARRECAEAHAAAEACAAAVSADGGQDTDGADDAAWLARLDAITEAIRQEAPDQRVSAARRAVAAAEETLEQRMQLLAPWRGDAATLAALVTPAAAAVDALASERAEAGRGRDLLRERIDTVREDAERLAAELAGLAAIAGEAGDTAAAEARARREQAWAAHRRALDEATADAFEAAMRHDDMVAEKRLTRQKELARAAQLRQDLATRRHLLAQLEARLREAEARIDAASRATRELAAGVSPLLAGVDAPEALAAWLQRREAALAAREPLLAARHQLEEALARRDEAAAELRRLLGASAPDDLPALMETASRMRRAAAAQRLRREELARARRNLEQRRRALQALEAEEAAWLAEWRSACGACWLGENGEAPPVTAARAALELLARLEAELAKRRDLATRISKMQRDQQRFTAAIAALVARVAPEEAAPELTPDAASAGFRRLEARAAAARETRRLRAALEQELEQTRDRLREAAGERLQLDGEIAAMAAHFGVETLAEVENAIAAAARRASLDEQIGQLEQQMLALTGAATVAAADHMLAGADRAALTAEAAAIETELADAQQRLQETYARRREAEKALAAIGSDSSAARLETRRQTLLLDIAGKTRAWLRLRLGVAAAEMALAAWRDSHRSSLLRQASEAFRRMSCGRWAGLTAEPGPNGEMLMAVAPDGALKATPDLSKGARFQLYLALRVAAYHEFAGERTPPPFVADDVMESFDDDRAGAALELLAEMAGKGQVIYLTHHSHLCDIARQRCPEALIHRLPD
ncbi:AAA family ATPase [Camelimonas abortus]|uniref:AAA family ATPase n=1 Tax=Camelimonas abortus TaxID=1017184 RepID=A0ABV7LBQ3_9HYPH